MLNFSRFCHIYQDALVFLLWYGQMVDDFINVYACIFKFSQALKAYQFRVFFFKDPLNLYFFIPLEPLAILLHILKLKQEK